MRVHLAGNVLNNALIFAKELVRAGVDARAFLPEQETGYASDRPEWEYGRDGAPADLVVRTPRVRPLRPSNARFVRQFVKADILHVMGMAPAWIASYPAPLPPVVFQPFGGDLQLMPWWRDGIAGRGVAFLMRLGIRRSSCAVIQPYQHHFLERLRYRGIVRDDLPWVVDFENIASTPPDEAVTAEYRGYRMVVYSPSRHAYDTHPNIGPYAKNNHVAIRGFARFVRATNARPEDVCLLMVDKGYNVSDSVALVESEGIQQFARFIREHPKRSVYAFLRLPQVVVIDQFPQVEMTIGGIAREAMFLGCPVITKNNVALTARQYGTDSVPILYAGDADDVAAQLRNMADDALRREHRAKVAQWASVHLADNTRLTSGLKEIYSELLRARRR
jgi:glycosyltransferase involved in cell wall biosynthesis